MPQICQTDGKGKKRTTVFILQDSQNKYLSRYLNLTELELNASFNEKRVVKRLILLNTVML